MSHWSILSSDSPGVCDLPLTERKPGVALVSGPSFSPYLEDLSPGPATWAHNELPVRGGKELEKVLMPILRAATAA